MRRHSSNRPDIVASVVTDARISCVLHDLSFSGHDERVRYQPADIRTDGRRAMFPPVSVERYYIGLLTTLDFARWSSSVRHEFGHSSSDDLFNSVTASNLKCIARLIPTLHFFSTRVHTTAILTSLPMSLCPHSTQPLTSTPYVILTVALSVLYSTPFSSFLITQASPPYTIAAVTHALYTLLYVFTDHLLPHNTHSIP